jgi:hypothetical protein
MVAFHEAIMDTNGGHNGIFFENTRGDHLAEINPDWGEDLSIIDAT